MQKIVGSTTSEPLAPEAEAALIVQAQGGDETAQFALLRQYAPAIRRALRGFADTMDPEDAEQEVYVAFLELLATHDPDKNPSLAGRIVQKFRETLSETAPSGASGFTVPARTMKRYLAILKKADNDLAEARRIAPEHDMKVSTFDAVTAATRTDTLDAVSEAETTKGGSVKSRAVHETIERASAIGADDAADPFEEVLDAELVALAFAAVCHDEATVVRQAYGFEPAIVDGHEMRPEGHAPLSDALVAASTGLSRPKVQRTRTAALVKMRDALEVAA
jgi:hypothetical protein